MKHNIKSWIDTLAASEGDTFRYDEEAIGRELDSHDQAYSGIVIKILSAVGGVLSTLAVLGFLLLAGLYESEAALFFTGILLIIAAVAISRITTMVYLDTVGIAIYVTGFVLTGIALADWDCSATAVLSIFCLIALPAILLSRGFMMVLLSVLVFTGCLLLFFPVAHLSGSYQQLPLILIGLGLYFFTIREAGILSGNGLFNRLYKPLQAGLFLSFVVGLVLVEEAEMLHWYFFPGSRVLSVAIIILICLLLYRIQGVLQVKHWRHKAGMYLLALAICVPVIDAPGIPGALLLLLLSFYHGYKVETGLSIVALVYFIVKFYYDLQWSLLHKSALLFFPGMVLILTWYYFNKQLRKDEQL